MSRVTAAPRGTLAAGPALELNPVACRAHGLCAEWLPERIDLDEWGYPIVDGRPLPAELVKLARQAAKQCPVRALRVT